MRLGSEIGTFKVFFCTHPPNKKKRSREGVGFRNRDVLSFGVEWIHLTSSLQKENYNFSGGWLIHL